MDRRIGVGIIGCGKIAQMRHLPEYAANPNAVLAGYYDLNRRRAEELAREYGGKAYTDYHALLADPDIDAVSVLTANDFHARISIEAMEAGKHVLCEKPMATTLEDCEAMVRTSRRTGKSLMIGHNQRLTKTHLQAREMIKEGAIGKLLTFRTSFGHAGPERWSVDGAGSWFFSKERAFLGVTADLGIHKIDLIQFLTNRRVTAVQSWFGTRDKRDAAGNPIPVEDNALCILELEDGAAGTLTTSWTHYGREDNSVTLYGDGGVMHLYEDPEYSLVIERRNGERILYNIDAIQTNDRQLGSGVIDLFVDGILRGKAPAIPGEEVMHAMKVVFAAVESSRSGLRTLIN